MLGQRKAELLPDQARALSSWATACPHQQRAAPRLADLLRPRTRSCRLLSPRKDVPSPKRDPGSSSVGSPLCSLTYIPARLPSGDTALRDLTLLMSPKAADTLPRAPVPQLGKITQVGKRHGLADKQLLAQPHVGKETLGCPWKAPSEPSAAHRGRLGWADPRAGAELSPPHPQGHTCS